jgi:hypothetical protein
MRKRKKKHLQAKLSKTKKAIAARKKSLIIKVKNKDFKKGICYTIGLTIHLIIRSLSSKSLINVYTMNATSLTLPEALLPYEAKIIDSVKPFIRISAQPNSELTLLESKFGGEPYWPSGQEYPKDAQGEPLHLLAQIECAALPPLEGFPTLGLLQFYVASEEMYGLNLDNLLDQSNFRVVYFSEVDENIALRDFSCLGEAKNLPITQSY